jgi:hypothetical protein
MSTGVRQTSGRSAAQPIGPPQTRRNAESIVTADEHITSAFSFTGELQTVRIALRIIGAGCKAGALPTELRPQRIGLYQHEWNLGLVEVTSTALKSRQPHCPSNWGISGQAADRLRRWRGPFRGVLRIASQDSPCPPPATGWDIPDADEEIPRRSFLQVPKPGRPGRHRTSLPSWIPELPMLDRERRLAAIALWPCK